MITFGNVILYYGLRLDRQTDRQTDRVKNRQYSFSFRDEYHKIMQKLRSCLMGILLSVSFAQSSYFFPHCLLNIEWHAVLTVTKTCTLNCARLGVAYQLLLEGACDTERTHLSSQCVSSWSKLHARLDVERKLSLCLPASKKKKKPRKRSPGFLTCSSDYCLAVAVTTPSTNAVYRILMTPWNTNPGEHRRTKTGSETKTEEFTSEGQFCITRVRVLCKQPFPVPSRPDRSVSGWEAVGNCYNVEPLFMSIRFTWWGKGRSWRDWRIGGDWLRWEKADCRDQIEGWQVEETRLGYVHLLT